MSVNLKRTFNKFYEKLLIVSTTDKFEGLISEFTSCIFYLQQDHGIIPLRSIKLFTQQLCSHLRKHNYKQIALSIEGDEFQNELCKALSKVYKDGINCTIPYTKFLEKDSLVFPYVGGVADLIYDQLSINITRTYLGNEQNNQEILRFLTTHVREIQNNTALICVSRHIFNSDVSNWHLPSVENFDTWFKERFIDRVKEKSKQIKDIINIQKRSNDLSKIIDSLRLAALQVDKSVFDFLDFLTIFDGLTKENIFNLDQMIKTELSSNNHYYPFEIASVISDCFLHEGLPSIKTQVIEHKLIEKYKLIPFLYLGDSNWGSEISKERYPIYITPDCVSDKEGALCFMIHRGGSRLELFDEENNELNLELYF